MIRTKHMIWGARTSRHRDLNNERHDEKIEESRKRSVIRPRHRELDNEKYNEKIQESKEEVSEDQDT